MTLTVWSWDMSAILREMRRQSYRSMVVPPTRTFVPTELFWSYLSDYSDLKIVDCGTGTGDLVKEAESRNLTMIGIDPVYRQGQLDNGVYSIDATEFAWTVKTIPLFCRPSHDGWVYDTLEKARELGSLLGIYIGLEKNVEHDLAEYKWRVLHGKVGADGERFYIVGDKA